MIGGVQLPLWPDSNALELHDCGWPVDSFACKIRHISLNTGCAKAGDDQ